MLPPAAGFEVANHTAASVPRPQPSRPGTALMIAERYQERRQRDGVACRTAGHQQRQPKAVLARNQRSERCLKAACVVECRSGGRLIGQAARQSRRPARAGPSERDHDMSGR